MLALSRIEVLHVVFNPAQGAIMRREARPVVPANGLPSDHYILNHRLRIAREPYCRDNKFDMSQMRRDISAGASFPLPAEEVDWATERPFSEL